MGCSQWNSFKPAVGKDAKEGALLKSPLLKYYAEPGVPGKDPLVRDA